MSRLSIRFFGAYQVTLLGKPLTAFRTDKERALLAYLAVEAQRPHTREHLAGLLWSDQSEEKALHSLRQSLSTLRKILVEHQDNSAYLLVEGDTIQFNPAGDCWLDTAEFEAALAHGLPMNLHSQAQPRPNIYRLQNALLLYQGNFLDQLFIKGGPLFEEWAILKRERFIRQVVEAMCVLVDYHEHRGEFELACRVAERVVALIPWEENAHQIVMRMMAQTGQWRVAALQYQHIRRYLAEELDTEPSPETFALMEDIRRNARENTAFPPRYASPPHNLPLEMTPFVGREVEMAALADWLAAPDCRLITLTGPGGIGKSRLALQAAREQTGLFSDGVFFVPLTAIETTDLLIISLAETVGFSFYSPKDPAALLIEYLQHKDMLLVLDNFEHLLADSSGAPKFLAALLANAPGVSVLVTSRQPLNLRIEQIIEIAGLTYPRAETDAVSNYSAPQLFNQVALRVKPGFSLQADQTSVVKICQLVEGWPLGIELSAAWARACTTHEIAAQIEGGLDFLATSMRDMPDRHRSARTVFDHSWLLLDEAEKIIFQQLAVFQGSFTLEAAEAITGADPEQIISLTQKSLLRHVSAERYELHSLLRQFASEKLAQDAGHCQRTPAAHGIFFANLLHSQEAALFGPDPLATQHILLLDIENIRASWRWACEHSDIQTIARATNGLGRFYEMRSWFIEGRETFTNAVNALQPIAGCSEETLHVFTAVVIQLAKFDVQLGDCQAAVSCLEAIIPQLRAIAAHRELSAALNTLGNAVYDLGEFDKAKACFSEGMDEASLGGDTVEMAYACNYLGNVFRVRGEFSAAKQRYEKSLAMSEQKGDAWGVASVLGKLGGMAGICGDYAEAERIFQQSLSINKTLDNQSGIAGCLHNLSNIAYIREEYLKARQLRLECLTICKEIGFGWGINSALKHLGDVERVLGNIAQAQSYYLESLAICEDTKDRRGAAFTRNSLGKLALHQGDFSQARQYFVTALQTASELDLTPLTTDILVGIAELWISEKQYETAYQLLSNTLNQVGIEKQTQIKGKDLQDQTETHLSAATLAQIQANSQTKSLGEFIKEILGR